MSADAIRVVIADDHAMFREGMNAVLSHSPRIQVVGMAANGHEAILLFGQLRPDVMVLDLKMPEMSGLEAMQAIHARHARARLLALTTFSGDALMRKAFAAGAAGYVLKHSVSAELIDAIIAVHSGRRYVSEQVAMILAESVTAAPLTERELQVLSRMSKGDSNRAIGTVLNISEETVKAHIKSIFSKTGASDRTQAVIMALQRGLLEL